MGVVLLSHCPEYYGSTPTRSTSCCVFPAGQPIVGEAAQKSSSSYSGRSCGSNYPPLTFDDFTGNGC